MVSFLYRLARAAAWGKAIGKAASGHPRSLVRRVRNREILRVVGRLLRK